MNYRGPCGSRGRRSGSARSRRTWRRPWRCRSRRVGRPSPRRDGARAKDSGSSRSSTPPSTGASRGRVLLRHDGLSQIPRATRPAPLPHRGFAAATYVNASSVVSAPYLPGWTALVFGDGPNNIRHQAKYLLPVAYALKRRGADPDSLERLAWMDCGAAESIARTHGTDATGAPRAHGSEPAACRRLRAPDFRGAWLWFAGLAETLFGRRTQLMVDVGGDGWLSSREGVVCFERAVVPGESDYLVRGPADARWLRHAAYAAVGVDGGRGSRRSRGGCLSSAPY